MLQVCTLLSGLVVHSMVLSTTPGAGSQAVGVGSTYRTLLRKRLGSTELADCRSGIMALRCLVSRLAREELQARALTSAHAAYVLPCLASCNALSISCLLARPPSVQLCLDSDLSLAALGDLSVICQHASFPKVWKMLDVQADRDPPFQLQCVQEAMTHVRHAWQACQASQKHQLPMLTTMLCDELASMAQKVIQMTYHIIVGRCPQRSKTAWRSQTQ